MPPVHVAHDRRIRVLLEEDVILATIVDKTKGLVGPVAVRHTMELRSENIVAITFLDIIVHVYSVIWLIVRDERILQSIIKLYLVDESAEGVHDAAVAYSFHTLANNECAVAGVNASPLLTGL